MNTPTIKLQVNGKTAELSLDDAREMLRQLKRVFGEIDSPPVSVPWMQPYDPRPSPYKMTRTPTVTDTIVWCGGEPASCFSGQSTLGGN